jgi:hypothetical protein
MTAPRQSIARTKRWALTLPLESAVRRDILAAPDSLPEDQLLTQLETWVRLSFAEQRRSA